MRPHDGEIFDDLQADRDGILDMHEVVLAQACRQSLPC
jgi:hypothetical protein